MRRGFPISVGELGPPLHEQKIEIKSFWIDEYPVTNAEFRLFLDATHYHPVDDHNFLKNWNGNQFPSGGIGSR